MSFTRELFNVTETDRQIVGGKALSLGNMIQNGFHTPNGFIIVTQTFDEVIADSPYRQTLQALLSYSEPKADDVPELSRQLQNTIEKIKFPRHLIDEIEKNLSRIRAKSYSIRSSAIHEDQRDGAWAGMLASYLHVPPGSSLIEKVKMCWASLYSGESLYYALQSNIPIKTLKTAVLVQEFIGSSKSGVAFSADPVHHNPNVIVIDAISGMGIPITDGATIPDHYVVDKTSLDVLRTSLGHQKTRCVPDENGGVRLIEIRNDSHDDTPTLSPIEVEQLARIILQLESFHQHPVDVEWTINNRGVFVLQCRAISTLSQDQPTTSKKNLSPAKDNAILWWSDFDSLWQFDSGIRSFCLEKDIVWNALNDVVYVRHRHKTSCYISEKDKNRIYERGSYYLKPGHLEQLSEDVDRCCAETRVYFQDLENISPSLLAQDQWHDLLDRLSFLYSRCVSLYRSSDPYSTAFLVDRLLEVAPALDITSAIMPRGKNLIQIEQQEWEEFVRHERSENEWLDYVKKYPWLVSNHHSQDEILTTMQFRYEQSRRTKWQEPVGKSERGDYAVNKDARQLVEILRTLASMRIQLKATFSSFDYYMIPYFGALGERHTVPIKDLYRYYTLQDLHALVDGIKLDPMDMEKRKEFYVGVLNGDEVEVFVADRARKIYDDKINKLRGLSRQSPNIIRGSIANRGLVRGFARIVNCNRVEQTNEARQRIKEGDILVSEMTQLNIMDLVSKAAAIVTDEGGMLSHAAIFSREAGIPCIVGTQCATEVIKDGDHIEVDAHSGLVRILESKE